MCNVNDGNWYVRAGGKLFFGVNFLDAANYRFRILKLDGAGKMIYDDVSYTDGIGISWPITETGNYRILVSPEGNHTARIDYYLVDID